MMLVGTNSLTAATNFPAIYVGSDNAIVIGTDCDGYLAAHGGGRAAGIGGAGYGSGLSPDSGWIIINSGTIVATSQGGGAAIGAGQGGVPADIQISGGHVTATGGPGGAGIGGAALDPSGGSGSTSRIYVYIYGINTTVVATGGDYAAGIGGGQFGGGGTIKVDGADVTVTATGGTGGAGIGGGYYGDRKSVV